MSEAAPPLPPFKLARFFAKQEHTAPFMACCSDCEPMTMGELLKMADSECLSLWNNLRLSYTETQGLPALREAIAGRYFTSITADQLVVAGPQECLYLAMHALLRPGDHVVCTFPGYQALYDIAKSLGCVVDYWEPAIDPKTAAVSFSVDDLLPRLMPSTRLVVINFPHNPTGAMLSHHDLMRVVEGCKERGAYLFSDEMYRLLELDPAARLPCVADIYSKGISLTGLTKVMSTPGLRIGWVATQDDALRARILELKDYTTICNSAPSEVLALIAVRAMDTILQRNLDTIRSNVKAFQALVDEFPSLLAWTPSPAASVTFPRLLCCDNIEAWCRRLAEAKGVALLPASIYDHAPTTAKSHFRVGLGRRNFAHCLSLLREHLEQE